MGSLLCSPQPCDLPPPPATPFPCAAGALLPGCETCAAGTFPALQLLQEGKSKPGDWQGPWGAVGAHWARLSSTGRTPAMAVEEGGCPGDHLHPHPLPEAPQGQESPKAQDRTCSGWKVPEGARTPQGPGANMPGLAIPPPPRGLSGTRLWPTAKVPSSTPRAGSSAPSPEPLQETFVQVPKGRV